MYTLFRNKWSHFVRVGLLSFSFLALPSPLWTVGAEVDGKISRTATWQWPDPTTIETKLDDWMTSRSLQPDRQLEVLKIWIDPAVPNPGPHTLDRLVQVLTMVEPRITESLNSIAPDRDAKTLPDLSWIDSELPTWARDSIRLAVARNLVQRRWFDEALVILEPMSIEASIDPSTLLYYRGACYHHLLRKKECLGDLGKLLERELEVPTRYAVTARMMMADMEPLKADSLDEVARMMNDVSRRLDLGRAGKQTLDGEQQVIEKLDKLIEDVEQQMQQQQQQQQQQQNQNQNQQQDGQQGKPAEDTKIAGETGPGDVDQKKLGDKSGWGNLPPAERQEALQRITKDLPSHYRDAIQEYFRKLATKPRD
ncbi:MAG: hypothetical protein J0M26_11935 [Planctomycetes bacterium]|nr:hypothetical protein [Planctomycetota bacterium]